MTILYRYRNKLADEEFEQKFGAVKEGISPDNKIAAFTFTAFFCFRRLVFAAVLVYLKDLPTLQLAINTVCAVLDLSYKLQLKPSIDPMGSKLEILNDAITLIISDLFYF